MDGWQVPGGRGPSFDGPGDYRWYCLDYDRTFNAGYDWFEGMSSDEILATQSPIATAGIGHTRRGCSR